MGVLRGSSILLGKSLALQDHCCQSLLACGGWGTSGVRQPQLGRGCETWLERHQSPSAEPFTYLRVPVRGVNVGLLLLSPFYR